MINKNISNDIIKNTNFVQKSPFLKFKVKIKKEIVKIGIPYHGVKKNGEFMLMPQNGTSFALMKML